MTYRAAVRYLETFANYEQLAAAGWRPERFNLERVRRVLAALGDPHQRFPSVHIAGSKGKGSTAAMTASILQAAGYNVGLYTSPHLIDLRERLQISFRPISRRALAGLVARCRPALEAHRHQNELGGLTWFEAITVLALKWFAEREVQMAVVEVGLGGRLDATNVLAPVACGITPIHLEHTEILGNSIAQIAAEKAGIIKPRIPVFIAAQSPGAEAVLLAAAKTQNAPATIVGAPCTHGSLLTCLPGRHQLHNAALATALARVCADIPDEAVARGLCSVKWAGRFQILGRDPSIILDCAHTREAARCVRETLEETVACRRLVLILGSLTDKDFRGLAEELLPLADQVILSDLANPRALEPEQMREMILDLRPRPVLTSGPAAALMQARLLAGEGDCVLVTGSTYLVGAALKALMQGRRQKPAAG